MTSYATSNKNNPKQLPTRSPTLLNNKKIKTLESVGTFNQTPVNLNQFDQSIVCKREVFVQNPFILDDMMSISDCSKIDDHHNLNSGHDFHFHQENEHKKSNVNNYDLDKVSKTETDANDIARMKMLFQSRVNNNQKQGASRIMHNKSMDRSPNTRSMEKHILKPTHTPSFNKFQPKTNTSYSCIQQKPPQNLKTNTHLNLNQSLICPTNNTQINSITHQQQKQTQQKRSKKIGCPPSSSKKSAMECSQISSKFQDYQFGYDLNYCHERSAQSKVSSENQHFQKELAYEKSQYEMMDRQATPKKIDFSDIKVTSIPQPQLSLLSQSKPKVQLQKQTLYKCPCESTLAIFMQQTNSKLSQLTERLMYLEAQNSRLNQFESKFNQQSNLIKEYQQQNYLMQSECHELRESNYSCQQEKEELESLLKEILFKREKQKYQKSSLTSVTASKENTYRQQDQIEEINVNMSRQKLNKQENRVTLKALQNYSEFHQNRKQNQEDQDQENFDFEESSKYNPKKSVESLCGIKMDNVQKMQQNNSQNYQDNSVFSFQTKQTKQSESKMKVQNLLSKLQIKIEKG